MSHITFFFLQMSLDGGATLLALISMYEVGKGDSTREFPVVDEVRLAKNIALHSESRVL